MAQECPLTASLTLKDTQSGFAGQTGTVWTIAPDCSFTVARQFGQRIAEPHRQGRLTAEQVTQLGDLLGRVEAAAPAAQIGGPPQANARQITFAYGGKMSVLNLPPGGREARAQSAAAGQSAARVLDLADAVKDMTGG